MCGADGVQPAATGGFLSVPSVDGTPTGIPVTEGSGRTPILVDRGNPPRLWAYVNGWKYVNLT